MSVSRITVMLVLAAVCVFSGCGLPGSLAEWREYRAVEALIAKGADLDAPDEAIDGDLRLHRAASEGYGAVVQLLLENQVNVDTRDGCGYTALHRAAMSGETDIAKQLLDARAYFGAKIEHTFRNDDYPSLLIGITPLHLAAWHGNLDTARLLLARGAKIDAAAKWGITPLHFAAGSGYLKMVKLLIAHGADPLAKARGKANALHFAAGGGMLVLQYRCDVYDPLIISAEAVRMPDIETEIAHCGDEYGEIVKLLLAKGAKVNPPESFCYTPLQFAAEYSCASAMEVLIKAGADATAKVPYIEDCIGGDPKDTTALHLAAHPWGVFDVDRYRRTIDALIRAGVPVNAANEYGTTALHIASHNARPEGIKLLLAAGADINAQSTGVQFDDNDFPDNLHDCFTPTVMPNESPDYKTTPLMEALMSSRKWRESKTEAASYAQRLRDTVAVLLKNGADVKAVMTNGSTALHIAAKRSDGAPLVRMLIDAGADVNAKTKGGVTPLHYAALADGLIWRSESQTSAYPDTESLKILLANGADPNAKTAETKYNLPETALDWAKEEKRTKAVKALTPVTAVDKLAL
ncbi:MAG: hypothetical protein GY794_16335 [bacterium]|nr:hypothetical protein [bacterium]